LSNPVLIDKQTQVTT